MELNNENESDVDLSKYKHDIQIRFGKMFIKHMIEKLDDFKELISNEIEEIMKNGVNGGE